MEISTFGGGGRLKECQRRLSLLTDKLSEKRLLLLPIPTTRDNKYISSSATRLSELLPLCDKETLVAGYGIPCELKERMESVGAVVFDAALDEDFLVRNAEITARGAIGRLMCESTLDITDMKIGIIGYGRIGKQLLKLALFLGAGVRVYTKRPEVMRDLSPLGIDCEIIGRESDLSSLDIVFNTAPEKIIDEERIASLPERIRIIDLASGNIFEPSARLTKLSSIPDAMYPETAGRLYAEAILKAIDGWVSK